MYNIFWSVFMKKSLMLVAACAIAAFMTGCMATHTNDAAAGAQVCVGKKFDADIVAGKVTISSDLVVAPESTDNVTVNYFE